MRNPKKWSFLQFNLSDVIFNLSEVMPGPLRGEEMDNIFLFVIKIFLVKESVDIYVSKVLSFRGHTLTSCDL